MKLHRFLVFILLTGFSGTALAEPMTLEQILDKVARAGKEIQSMKSGISQKKWTAILEEFDEGEQGELTFLKQKGELFLRKDITKPQSSYLVIAEGQVTFYQPRIKQAQKYNLGGNKDKAEFLLLGFGSSREALEEAYQIRLVGTEEVGGQTTHVIELEPKSTQVSAYFARIVLWIDPQLWVPVRQKLVEPTEDYLLIDFDNIALNPKLSRSSFQLKLPKDVRVVGG